MNKIIEAIRGIERKKKESKIVPDHALEIEILQLYPQATEEIERLLTAGKLHVGRTINSRYFVILCSKRISRSVRIHTWTQAAKWYYRSNLQILGNNEKTKNVF